MNGIHLALTLCFCVVLIQQGDAIQCSMCTTETDGWNCLAKPPPHQDCPGFDYCMIVEIFSTVTAKLVSYTRTCSAMYMPEICMEGRDTRGEEHLPIQACYKTCSTNGCNGSRSLHHLIDLLRRRRRK